MSMPCPCTISLSAITPVLSFNSGGQLSLIVSDHFSYTQGKNKNKNKKVTPRKQGRVEMGAGNQPQLEGQT